MSTVASSMFKQIESTLRTSNDFKERAIEKYRYARHEKDQ
jgi:hypothetical protein